MLSYMPVLHKTALTDSRFEEGPLWRTIDATVASEASACAQSGGQDARGHTLRQVYPFLGKSLNAMESFPEAAPLHAWPNLDCLYLMIILALAIECYIRKLQGGWHCAGSTPVAILTWTLSFICTCILRNKRARQVYVAQQSGGEALVVSGGLGGVSLQQPRHDSEQFVNCNCILPRNSSTEISGVEDSICPFTPTMCSVVRGTLPRCRTICVLESLSAIVPMLPEMMPSASLRMCWASVIPRRDRATMGHTTCSPIELSSATLSMAIVTAQRSKFVPHAPDNQPVEIERKPLRKYRPLDQ